MATVTPPDEWGQEVVGSTSELAARLRVAVWVPSEWPSAVERPELAVVRSPDHDAAKDGYQLRGTDSAGRLLVVAGHRRSQGGRLSSGLRLVAGEHHETLAEDADREHPHVVVRLPVFDVHVTGDALTRDAALGLARSLVEVTTTP
jgi:hypothetical protein